MRYSKLGIQLEGEMEQIRLQKMKDCGQISNFGKYPRNSAQDHDGKDFWVTKDVNKITAFAEFGVT